VLIEQFPGMLRIGQWREIEEKQILIEEGQKVDQILFIYNGLADVLSNGQKVNYLKDGAFIGDMNLSKDRPAVATVKTTLATRYLAWPSVDIKQLLIRNPSMNSTIQTIFSMDLMQKLQRQASASIRE
jgi:CRP-like cAMP-binding protein